MPYQTSTKGVFNFPLIFGCTQIGDKKEKRKKERIDKDKEKVNKIWKRKETKFYISQQQYLIYSIC